MYADNALLTSVCVGSAVLVETGLLDGLEAAKKKLATGSTAVDDVSAAVGYEDPTSFRRLFKRKAGLTPAIYRKKFATITMGVPH